MNGQLIDTNVLSEIRKRDRANPGVLSWFESADSTTLWLSVLVIAEIRLGVERIRHRDLSQATQLGRWIERIEHEFANRILPIDVAVATRWSTVAVHRTLPVIDGLLAATALHHDLVLVTRNLTDLSDTGVDVLNPFSDPKN